MKKHIKNAIILICTILICISISGCSNTQKVEKVLSGTWVQEFNYEGQPWEMRLIFNNGTITSQVFISGTLSNQLTKYGTYRINEDAILVTYDNGTTSKIDYSIESGKVIIEMPDGVKKR